MHRLMAMSMGGHDGGLATMGPDDRSQSLVHDRERTVAEGKITVIARISDPIVDPLYTCLTQGDTA